MNGLRESACISQKQKELLEIFFVFNFYSSTPTIHFFFGTHFEDPVHHTSCFLCFHLCTLGDVISKDTISRYNSIQLFNVSLASLFYHFSAIKLLRTNVSKPFKAENWPLTRSSRVWCYDGIQACCIVNDGRHFEQFL
jgi:hypothetical protein